MDTKILDELNRRVRDLIAATPAKDIEKNLRALLSSAFSRLDLVTREEFDVQQEVLRHTREKLQQMEARVAELEAKLSKKGRGARDEGRGYSGKSMSVIAMKTGPSALELIELQFRISAYRTKPFLAPRPSSLVP